MLQPSSMQLGGLVGGAAGHLGPLDRDGVEDQGRRGGLDPVVEEVVGRGGGEHLVAVRLGQRRDEQAGVEVAVVVGGEDHRAVEVGEAVEAAALGLGQPGDDGPDAAPSVRKSGRSGPGSWRAQSES